MTRFKRRSLAVVLGLALGWFVAGVAGNLFSAGTTLADDSTAQQEHVATDEADHGGPSEEMAVETLVPQGHDAAFMRPVVYAAGGLFVAAVVLGIPALSLTQRDEPGQ